MSPKMKYFVLYTLFLALLGFSLVTNVYAQSSASKPQVVILFDESHGQFFNRTLYRSALADLNNSNYYIVFNTQTINKTTFEGVDIFVSTNPGEGFSTFERFYITEFLKKGKSAFLLANPLIEDNESLNGRGDLLNDILNEPELETISRFWTNPNDLTAVKRADVVINEFENAGKDEYLEVQLNSSDHEILNKNNNNVTSIITYSCSVEHSREDIITAPSQAYAKTVLDDIHDYASNIVLFGSPGKTDYNTRIVLSGSSIMFSDINDNVLNQTWYESANNSILWNNIFDWLTETVTEEEIPSIPEMEVLTLIEGIVIVTLILITVGTILYRIGTGREISIVKTKEKIKKEQTVSEQETKRKLKKSAASRRQRRFQQIKQKDIKRKSR
ncbi:MAG: hypothetical protein ACTSW1_12360 [Candidatus Hodarchaeales archaeon]